GDSEPANACSNAANHAAIALRPWPSALGRRTTSSSFFLYDGSAFPRALHSFPTRRSSDLTAATGDVAGIVTSGGAGEELGSGVRDRKSTRLNSSHDQKSYAVFCLKKKSAVPARPVPPSPAVVREPTSPSIAAPRSTRRGSP